jgi:hypothetical protein
MTRRQSWKRKWAAGKTVRGILLCAPERQAGVLAMTNWSEPCKVMLREALKRGPEAG